MKKGISLNQLPQIFTVIIFVGIIVGASYITLASFRSTQFTSTAVTEELTMTKNSYTTPTYPYLTSDSAVTNVSNTSLILTSSNWTVDLTSHNSAGDPQYQINFTGGAKINDGDDWNVTYTYNKGNTATTGINYVVTFLDNITSNLPVVGIIIFIVVMISALMYLRTKKTGGGA